MSDTQSLGQDRPARAFVLGAGASAAYSLSPTDLRMPLARNFLDAVLALPQTQHPWVNLHGLFNYLEDTKKIDPVTYLSSSIDIEELHSEIYAAALAQLARTGTIDISFTFKAHHELIFLFAYVINLIQNGPPSPTHRQIAELLKPGDAIVTFNWDTLMDRALAEVTAWRGETGYGIQPNAVFRDGWQAVVPSSTLGPVLWKLHGSTNWITSHEQVKDGEITLIQDASPELVNVFESTRAAYPCWKGRFMDGFGPFSYGYFPPNLDLPGKSADPGHAFVMVSPLYPWVPDGTAPSSGLLSMPLIVPPVKDKAYDRFGSLFHTLWNGAETLLADADEIIVIGYSFPRTDHRSLTLFKEAFKRKSSVPSVVVVDPYPQRAVDVFRYELGIPGENIQVHARALDSECSIGDLLGA